MNRFFRAFGLSLCVLLVNQVAFGQSTPRFKPRNITPSEPLQDFIVGEPAVHGNLAVFPVSSRLAKNLDRFITLDQGLAAGTVQIYEMGTLSEDGTPQPQQAANDNLDDPLDNPFAPAPANARRGQGQRREQSRVANDVNRLLVLNKSSQPLYLMPGEIIVGGSQDRTIAREVIIPPSKKPVAIEVFCIEHGRWGAREQEEYSDFLTAVQSNVTRASSVAIQAPTGATPGDVARQANSGKFIGSVGSLNKASRLAVQSSADQQKVWQEVGKENSKAGVKSSSGAFTGNYAERHAVNRLEPYIKKLQGPVAETENVVGVIVAVNGKVESMDVFESTPLFKKLWPKLLKSYALDAANASRGKSVAKVATRSDAAVFMEDVVAATSKKSETHGSVAVSRRESVRVLVFTAREAGERRQAALPGAGPGTNYGGLGGGIHSSAYGK
jgi:hypothetical protein